MKLRPYLIGLLAIIWICVSGCTSQLLPNTTQSTPINKPTQPVGNPVSTEPAISSLPQSFIEFRVLVPDDTPTTDKIYLMLLDEVTGLYLNSQSYPMTLDESTGLYTVKIPFPMNSVVKYRYERQGDELRTAEHTADGQPVRYRMVAVDGPGSVDDIVSRWTDSQYNWPSGRLTGMAIDASTKKPIPDLLITAGGAQTFTSADGSFLIEKLPPGIHNVIGYATDGSYNIFQQGAEIAADSTTPAELNLTPSKLVNVTFNTKVPENTPPLVPVRLAGNLYQLGDTFGTLTGGVSSIATRMPVMTPQKDGTYTTTVKLPVGADIRYKYTLGDGYWNAEHSKDGGFQLRQLIVPDQDLTINDSIDSWETNPGKTVTFDVTVPENTPAEDSISIQFNPLFGWTEPVPMWNLGNNRWAYVLYSPLNLPGNLSYRYCRNSQCGAADDIATPGLYGKGRSVDINKLPQQIKEKVDGWVDLGQNVDPASVPTITANSRTPGFVYGIEFLPLYHPSWQPLIQQSLQQVKDLGANWVTIDPTWAFTDTNPPVLQPVAGQDTLWTDLIDTIQKAHDAGLKVSINAKPTFTLNENEQNCDAEPCPTGVDAWWQAGTRDFSWWLVWFDHYRNYLINFADLATKTNAESLVIGGDWLTPALPNGTLYNGQPSGVPEDADKRWRELIADVRQHYSGPIVWAISDQIVKSPPGFLDAVDQISVEWNIKPGSADSPSTSADLENQFSGFIDNDLKNLQTSTGKPILLALNAPSDPDLNYQLNTYQAIVDAVNQRDWISGFMSSGYYPVARIQDKSASVHGKPAEILLQNWFTQLSSQGQP